MISRREQIRIQLAIVFITFYAAIILAYKDKLSFTSLSSGNLFSQLLFGIFILGGIFIILIFFLSLIFTALELDFHKEKVIVFEQTISLEKIARIKRHLYNLGVSTIFLTLFAYPVYFLYSIISSGFNQPWSFLIWTFCLLLVVILVNIIFSDRKILIKKDIEKDKNSN